MHPIFKYFSKLILIKQKKISNYISFTKLNNMINWVKDKISIDQPISSIQKEQMYII